MSADSEQAIALYEAERNRAWHSWFAARGHIPPTDESTLIFDGGFRMAWELCRAQPAPQPAEQQPIRNDKVRAEFEAWASTHFFLQEEDTIIDDSDEYISVDMQLAWEAWYASRAAPDVAELVDALTTARETIAAALRANELDYFATDADIARHVAIQPIDTALAVFRKKGGSND